MSRNGQFSLQIETKRIDIVTCSIYHSAVFVVAAVVVVVVVVVLVSVVIYHSAVGLCCSRCCVWPSRAFVRYESRLTRHKCVCV